MPRTLFLTSPASAATLTGATFFIQKYIFDDWDFVAFLMLFVVLDTVTGIFSEWKESRPSSKAAYFCRKVLIYASLLVVGHGLTKFPIHGIANNFFVHFFDAATYTALMAREALSIFENLAKLDPKLVPARLRRKLEQVVDGTDELIAVAVPEQAPNPIPEPAPDKVAEIPPIPNK